MGEVDVINNFLKIFIIFCYMYCMFELILGYKDRKFINYIIVISFGIVVAIIYVIIMKYFNQLFIVPIFYFSYTIILKSFLQQKTSYCLFLTNIFFVITYIIYFISVLISGTFFISFILLFLSILVFLFHNTTYNNTASIFIIFCVMLLIYFGIRKIKRLKNGVNFLKNVDNINKTSPLINIISIIVFIIFGILDNSYNVTINTFLFALTIISLGFIIYWIHTQITKYYKKNMRDRTIEVQKTEIDEQKKIIEEIKQENIKLADVVHKYNNRLSAVENALEDAISKNMNTEFANELSVILSETKEIAKNFAKESEVTKLKLPLTNIPGIDNMFKYMQKEAIDNNINFDFKLNNSIHDLIDNIISKDKFETMLGDHLRDAIIAVNNSKNSYKSILVTLGIVENCYELSVYDTGIEFEIDTLLRLGKERVTTHKNSGGSGIGFMTTFETLKEIKASLSIEEYNPQNSSYTKSVNIIFDGKNEYRIYSYRAEEIKKQNKDKRIIIKDI